MLAEDALGREPRRVSISSQSASLTCAGTTAWNALFVTGSLKAGDTVVLLGTGGVSIWALQLAKAAGARVIITSSSDEKLDARPGARRRRDDQLPLALRSGAPRCCGSPVGEGADQVVEVGRREDDRAVARVHPRRRRHHVIGAVSGMGGGIAPRSLIAPSARVLGVYVGSRAMHEDLARAVAINSIRPVMDRTFAFDEAPAAYRHFESGQHFGKVGVVRSLRRRARTCSPSRQAVSRGLSRAGGSVLLHKVAQEAGASALSLPAFFASERACEPRQFFAIGATGAPKITAFLQICGRTVHRLIHSLCGQAGRGDEGPEGRAGYAASPAVRLRPAAVRSRPCRQGAACGCRSVASDWSASSSAPPIAPTCRRTSCVRRSKCWMRRRCSTRRCWRLIGRAATYYHHPARQRLAAALPRLLREGATAAARSSGGRRRRPGAAALAGRRRCAAPRASSRCCSGWRGSAAARASSARRWRATGARRRARSSTRGLVTRAMREAVDGAGAIGSPRRAGRHRELADEQRRWRSCIGRALRAATRCVLLDGITGSGKTEVYLHAVEQALARGRTALVLCRRSA